MPSFDFVTYRFTIVKGGEKFNRCVEKGKFLGLPDDCLIRQPLNEIPAVSFELSSGFSCFASGCVCFVYWLPACMSTMSSSHLRESSLGIPQPLGFRVRVPALCSGSGSGCHCSDLASYEFLFSLYLYNRRMVRFCQYFFLKFIYLNVLFSEF